MSVVDLEKPDGLTVGRGRTQSSLKSFLEWLQSPMDFLMASAATVVPIDLATSSA